MRPVIETDGLQHAPHVLSGLTHAQAVVCGWLFAARGEGRPDYLASQSRPWERLLCLTVRTWRVYVFPKGLNDCRGLTTKITCSSGKGRGTVSAIDLHPYLHKLALEKACKHFSKNFWPLVK